MSNVPKFDSRSAEDIMVEIKNLAAQYTPEWSFDANSDDLGIVFSKVYSKMMENTITKYNRMSYNYYLTFLNTIGTKLRPASPAEGVITVSISPGSEPLYIEKGSSVYADADTDDGSVVYETIDSLTAVDTSIQKIYFTEPDSDFIGCVYTAPELGGDSKEKDDESSEEDSEDSKVGSFRIFDNLYYDNLQRHEIYIGDEVIFNMSKTDIEFSFYDSFSAKNQKKLPELFSDKENVVWEYYDGKNWIGIENTEKTEFGVRVRFNGLTKPTSIMDNESRYVRCCFKKVPDNGLSLTSIKYHTVSEELSAEDMFSGDAEVKSMDFFPFEEQYTLYSDFAIKCDEALTKKGAIIEILVDMQFVKVKTDAEMPGKKYKIIMSDIDFADLDPKDIEIRKVKWEYWNGKGWALLTSDESAEKFFTVQQDMKETQRILKFKCPDDIESISVGSSEGNFIRARISKMKDQFDFYANYITPYIHELKIRYHYEGDGHAAREIYVNSNLKNNKISLNKNVLQKIMVRDICKYPAMYMCLSRSLPRGMIRIMIEIEEGIHRFNPTLRWEYLADDRKGGTVWKHIEIMDNTEDFSHTDTVTLIGKSDFKKSKIFGIEGYFIRIVNPDKRYSENSSIAGRPVVNDIKFNAVRLIQRDTKEPEYFAIDVEEENKVCTLASKDASFTEVWVNEIGKLTTNEQEKLLKLPPSSVEAHYDDLGQLEELWVKWKPVPSIMAYGPDERVYEIDYSQGEIKFGDGRNGKIPPSQYNESIRVQYSICNGNDGNIESHEIVDFVSSIGPVEDVDNPTPIMGGVDMETIDGAAQRMFAQISSGNRIVSLDDFENAICFNDRNIYKVKCVSHTNEDSEKEIGVTSIAVLPREFKQGHAKFQGIKDKIWQFVDEKAPATLSNSSGIRIFEVHYVETIIKLEIVIDDFNYYQGVYNEIESKLKEFLNPVSGNFSHKGWNIGDFPRKELVYNYIKTVKNLKWIKSINVFTNLLTPEGKKEIDYENIRYKKFIVPIYGEPEINITVN
ncbi:MAG: hypothetical protein ACI4PJ_03510 [Acutalibacteraceae bacterium]